MSEIPEHESWLERARRLVEPGSTAPLPPAGEGRRALAWALKELCYAAWSSEPQRAAPAAAALRRLCTEEAGDAADPPAREVAALADWTEGIALVAGGRMSEAVQSFDAAAAAFRALGQDDHAAQTQVPKIMALSMLGRHDDAAACGERTHSELLAQGNMRAAGKVSLNLGSLQVRRGAYALAAARFREAVALFVRVGDLEHSVMADIGLAEPLELMGDFDGAMAILVRARHRAREHGFPVLEAIVDEYIAMLELARGRYPEALAGLERSRWRYEQLAMPQHLAIAEKQLGDAYLELRLLPEALALFDPALAKFQALSMPDDQAWTLTQRGRALALLGRAQHANDSFARAAELFAAQRSDVGQAAVALARAELALVGGDSAAALVLARDAAAGFLAAGQAEGQARADVVQARGLLHCGEVDLAQEQFDATLHRARELHLISVQVRCLTGQGLVARERSDVAAAREAFEAAIVLFEEQRRALPGDEIRGAFLSDHLVPYQELLRMTLQTHERDASSANAAQVLFGLDRFRARVLSDRVTRAAGADGDAATQMLRARLNRLYRRTLRLDQDAEPSAALHDELRRAEHELLELARRRRLTEVLPEQAATPDEPFSTQALQGRLGGDGAMVEYGVLDDELFACVVTDEGVRIQRRLAHWPDVLEALRAAWFQIDALRHGAAPALRHLPMLTERTRQRMQRLHALVWAPLAGALSGCGRVLVVPHGPLGSLPFGALHDGQCWLAESLELATAASGRMALRAMQCQPIAPERALALGESSRLPHAASEARFVAGLFAQGSAFVGEQASLATLREQAPQADVIHLACHAQFRPDNPMFSALHLADGALTVEWAENLRLRPGTVVLSACETGQAELGSGDERVGLVRAFLGAGASRVLAALWPIDDAVTEGLMASFYGALRAGEGPAAALRSAQAATMRHHPHPFYWGAFTLHGGW